MAKLFSSSRCCLSYACVALALLSPFSCRKATAQVSLPKVLSDHMVLQRDKPICIWGYAAPAESVEVSFHQQVQRTAADALGRWSVVLQSEQAGGPYTLTARGSTTVRVTDVLMGDVWLASGQSNMEMPLKGFSATNVVADSAEAIAGAHRPELRLLRLAKHSSPYPLADQSASWTECTPETAADFSAVAYFFGREIAAREHVPIGLIDSTWGGTPAEAWTSLEGLSADASLMPIFSTRAMLMQRYTEVAAAIRLEQIEDATAKAAGQPVPVHKYHPPPENAEPGGLYNAMIAPLTRLQVKGVIWYQGEQNTADNRASIYARLFHALVTDWRAHFAQGDFPFLFVQLSSYAADADNDWGTLRDAQRRTLDLRNTAMAVSLDVGEPNNIHPANKEAVGHRLALAARAVAYGEQLEYEGPLYRQIESARNGTALRIRFDHATALNAKDGPSQGFEIAGANHHFTAAVAEIDGKSVVLRSSSVAAPMYVRYAWPNAPTANLTNEAGLPASTFTSEMSQ